MHKLRKRIGIYDIRNEWQNYAGKRMGEKEWKGYEERFREKLAKICEKYKQKQWKVE